MSRWNCPTCSKNFARKGDLTRHELLHTGIKPHVCETCGKGFSQFSGLKTHWNVHTKARPYICGIGTCVKAFGDPSSRARHRKETHRREGAYKCILSDCGTRIKRRSAFVAHLRKHGFDPRLLDLDAIVGHSGGITTPTHFGFSDAENKSLRDVESRSALPSFFGDKMVFYPSGDGDEAADNNRWSSDRSFNCRPSWGSGSNALFLDPMFDQTASASSSGVPIHPNQHCFDGIFPDTVDYPFHGTSPLSLPVLDPFLEGGSDGYHSSSSSPSSTYAALYTADFNDDMALPSLANDMDASQKPHLYDIL